MRRRSRTWLAAGILGMLVSGILLPWLTLEKRRAAALAAHEADLAAREARGFDRPSLLLPPAEGDAVDAYAEALRRTAELSADARALLRNPVLFYLPVPFGEDPRLGELDGSVAPVVEAVRDALRRSRFRFDLDFRPGLSGWKDRNLSALGPVLLLHLEQALALGREDEALRTCLDLMAFGSDVLRGIDSYWVLHAPSFETMAILQLDQILSTRPLPTALLREALSRLDRIEASFPRMEEACRIHFLLCRQSIALGDLGSLSVPPPGWRHLCSTRVLEVSVVAKLDAQERACLEIFRAPPRDRLSRSLALDEAFRSGERLLGARNWHAAETYAVWDLEQRAQLDLLRTAFALALHEAETGSPPGRLEELVPLRIPTVPVCGRSGRRFGYVPGRVWWTGFDQDDDGGRPLPIEGGDLDGDLVIRLRSR